MTQAPAQTLLMLPGWGMGPDCWGAFGAALESRYRVIRTSLPGHGAVPESSTWSLASEAERLLTLAPGASWLAWSLGALVALTAAARAPDRIPRLVLLGATPRFQAAGDWPQGMAPDAFQAFRTDCRRDPEKTLQRFHGLQVKGSEQARPTLAALRQGQLPGASVSVLDRGLELLAVSDLRDALGTIETPCLWLSGERDAVTPAGAAMAASPAMPRSRVSCVPGAGHAPFLSHPDETLTRVLDFLDEPQS